MSNKNKLLKEIKTDIKLYKILINNYHIKNICVSKFLIDFDLNSEEEIVNYVLSKDNVYELGKYGYRENNEDKIYAYNGFGNLAMDNNYQRVYCTLGSKNHFMK